MRINLDRYPDHLSTTKSRTGATRGPGGRLLRDHEVTTVGQHPPGTYQGSAATVAAYDALNAAWVKDGGNPLRLTSALRDQQGEQARLWAAYRRGDGPPANRPNQSHHGWGGAVDVAVAALRHQDLFPVDARWDDDALDDCLERLWALMSPHGFTPIVSEPFVAQAESWHFDHLGPLRYVRSRYLEEGASRSYAKTAAVGCALAYTIANVDARAAHLQARLALWAARDAERPWVGTIDGKIGRKSKAALKAAGFHEGKGAVKPGEVIKAMDEASFCVKDLAAL